MKVKLPITHIEEVEIPNEVFYQYIKEKFQERFPGYKIGSYLDPNTGKLKEPWGYDGFSHNYEEYRGEHLTEMLAVHGLWEQIDELYHPSSIERREEERKKNRW
ncbi:MAG TPA: hypothetical protein VFM18_17935 [Methanosarcina sp.]|nr:hypothetical protein [Methanosarcina sp.]